MADTFDLQNLSFSNPNYYLNSPDLNSNSECVDEEEEEEDKDDSADDLYVCSKTRRSYAHLAVAHMGVTNLHLTTQNNLSVSDGDDLETTNSNNNNLLTKEVANNKRNCEMGRKTNGFLDYYISLESGAARTKQDPSSDPDPEVKPCEIPHIQGSLTNDLYAVPIRKTPPGADDVTDEEKQDQREKEEADDELLPPGWERHQDDDGPYYWHISSGTIQREPPPSSQANQSKRISRDLDVICNLNNFGSDSSSTSSSDQGKNYPQQNPIRFAVRSLGWVEIAEDDLTPERSSRAVNKCIVDLSLGRNDIMDVVGRWGDGKDLFMDLDDYCLRLIDTQDMTILNTQAIHSIRVWGVGRDNGRDFAYVARDRNSRKHMCHVFRCDMPARVIANTLRDICKKIMIERSLQNQSLAKQVVPKSLGSCSDLCAVAGGREGGVVGGQQIFPTPMEEPRKVLKVHYLGSTQVSKPTGMETVNIAIDRLMMGVPVEDRRFVNVAVAPSTITITDPGEEGKVITECRVRFLSFLGIGRNVKTCAFVVHTAQEQYIAHVFHCEPSSGALCKTIEAACKLRYQKCLDAHRQAQQQRTEESQQNKKIGATIRNVLGTITTRLSKTQPET